MAQRGARRAARLRAALAWILRHLVGLQALQALQPLRQRHRPAALEAAAARSGGQRTRSSSASEPAAAAKPGPANEPAATAKPRPASDPPSTLAAAAGTALFGGLALLAGARPAALPAAFLAFAATALPWRVFHYTRTLPHYRMFLLDMCYAVAVATAAFLCLPATARASQPGLEAAVYALADGPVAAALLAWQCAWVFHSPEHTVSVLLHLLPGLAMAAHHHLPGPGTSPALSGFADTARWLLAAPLAFYVAWQAAYFVVVQLGCERLVRAQNLDTSYRHLTRRARRADSIWARLVLHGSRARRLAVYGALQLGFTAVSLLLFLPTYFSAPLACAWQACKFLLPVYFGCKYSCERLYKAAMAEGVRRHLSQREAAAGGAAAAS